MVTYHYEQSRRAKTPELVRQHLRELRGVLGGGVEVQIGVWQAFNGCASPLRIKLDDWDTITDESLRPILDDHPAQTAQIVPVY